MPKKPCLDLRELRSRVVADIRAERAAKSLNAEERKNSDSYIRFVDSHVGSTVIDGVPIFLIEHPYALVVKVKCPWPRCSQVYRVARFVSRREGEAFFLVCTRCRERVITLRDIVAIYGTNTYPVRQVQEKILTSSHYESNCRRVFERFMERYALWKLARAKKFAREKVLAPETSSHRALTMRTTVETNEDTKDHLNARRKTRKIKDLWGV